MRQFTTLSRYNFTTWAVVIRIKYLSYISLIALFPSTLAAEEILGFNSHVRPVLSDHCFACHGFDANAREANLRLDIPEAAYTKGKNGTPIVPGKPEESLIWQRIISDDPDEVMPPADHFLKLDDQEKALLKRWIEQGAKYEKHWTFLPVVRPAVPESGDNPVDTLVTKRLEKEDLKIAEEADKRTLIRRLSFDLRGLSPTSEEVEQFLADDSPDAWPKLVDRFLADPAFGERFAWPWLDSARYADSNGFQGDRERTMWPWRDWVIDALNKNLPYDDFTVWQIAGDLLPNATFEQKLATGFLRNHSINGEGGSIPEENRVNYVFDMAETVGTVWMGLTFNCCRCHDHKYDPLAQKEYYELTAFFNQSPVNGGGGDPQTKPILAVPSPEQVAKKSTLKSQISQCEAELKALTQTLHSRQNAWEETQRSQGDSSIWKPFKFTSQTTSNQKLTLNTLPDQSLLATGANPRKATFTLKAPVPDEPITSFRLDAIRHPSMTKGRIARSDSGNFVLTSVEVYLHQKGQPRKQLLFNKPEATFEQGIYQVAKAIDQDRASGWAVLNNGKIDRDHAAIFPLREPLTPTPDSHLEIILRHDSRFHFHFLGRFRLSHSSIPSATLSDQSNPILPLLKISPEKRSKEQLKTIRSAFLASQPEHAKLTEKIQSFKNQIVDIDQKIPKVMVMEDMAKKRKTHILAIGSYEARGDVVEAGTPAILPPLNASSDSPNRLDLARWLVSPEHPLTSRVTVNRLWQDLFGIGLIKSPEDLGVQSEIPVHRELLDWLAADFMESGWDYKKLIKTIVTSRVYRQSSAVDSLALERDPDNRLLARAPRYRLPSWMIRDQALALSGRLVPTLGGAPVKPYQPPGLWSEVTFGNKKYVPDTGEKIRRRSLYTFWRRISAPAMVFDNAKRENCEVGAYRTNSPLHALATLNDPLYTTAARDLVLKQTKTGQTSEETLIRVFESINIRPPSAEELKIILGMYQQSLDHFNKDRDAARDLRKFGDQPLNKEGDMVIQAALTTTALSLLNTDEALSKE